MRPWRCFIVLLGTLSCALASSWAAAAPRLRFPLVVLSGGYGSCRTPDNPMEFYGYLQLRDLQQRYDNELERIQKDLPLGEQVRTIFIVSCFRSDVSHYASYRIIINGRPYLSWGDLGRDQSVDGLIETILRIEDVDGLPDGDGINDPTHLPLFVAGHSHGGWLAMKIVESLPRGVKAALLATLDPISRRNCTPETLEQMDPQCREAPADIPPWLVKERADSWFNFYQTKFAITHSQAINGAQNFCRHYTYPGPLDEGEDHSNVRMDPWIWQKIRTSIEDFMTQWLAEQRSTLSHLPPPEMESRP